MWSFVKALLVVWTLEVNVQETYWPLASLITRCVHVRSNLNQKQNSITKFTSKDNHFITVPSFFLRSHQCCLNIELMYYIC